MSIELTNIVSTFQPILATNPQIPDNKYKPNKVMHEYHICGSQTGDASAGSVYGYIDFGDNFDSRDYIVITFITFKTSANSTFSIGTDTDRWENLNIPNFANIGFAFYKSVGAYYPQMGDHLKKPLYLGRYRRSDSNPGRLDFNFNTNTNGESYSFSILGYTLERPLPFTSILQP